MRRIAKGSSELFDYFKDLGFEKLNSNVIRYDKDPYKRKSGTNIEIGIYASGLVSVTYTTDDFYQFYKGYEVDSIEETKTLVKTLIKNKDLITKNTLNKSDYQELPESVNIVIKEDVKIGNIILEAGDKIKVLESSLRFTGKDIPKKLIKQLDYLGKFVTGFDHSDKGFQVQFSKWISPKTIAQLLKVDTYQVQEDDDDETLYYISTNRE